MAFKSFGKSQENPSRLNANDRMKAGWNRWLGGSLAAAAALHLAVFVFAPSVRVSAHPREATQPARLLKVAAIAATPLPAPGGDISIPVPAIPLVDDLVLDETILPTIPLPDFTDVSILSQALLPKLESEAEAWHDYRKFAPFVVRPTIRNREEMKRFLERHYQPILEFSGATGVVHLSFFIDEQGMVERAEIEESSGSRSLDRLAMRLSRVLRFRPAMLAGRPIRIHVRLPITFRAA
jgi:TonB family protein